MKSHRPLQPDEPKHDRCGPTRKIRYRTKSAAHMALAAVQLRLVEQLDHRRREQRAYSCDFCGGWHLTSRPEAKSA